MIAVLLRVGAVALALGCLFLVLSVMGAGVGTVLVGMLGAAVVWHAILRWARDDARRATGSGPVILRWVTVTVLLVALYVAAGRLAPGSYGEEMGLVELVCLSAALGVVFVLLPAALGIARGSSLRRT